MSTYEVRLRPTTFVPSRLLCMADGVLGTVEASSASGAYDEAERLFPDVRHSEMVFRKVNEKESLGLLETPDPADWKAGSSVQRLEITMETPEEAYPYGAIILGIHCLDTQIHTKGHPFCEDPGCPCHEDRELVNDLNEQVSNGSLTPQEATLILHGSALPF